MCATLGVSPASDQPDRVLEKCRGPVWNSKQVPPQMWTGTINPGPRRATPPFGGQARFCARIEPSTIEVSRTKGVTSHECRLARSFQYPDPETRRYHAVLRGYSGAGEGRPAEFCLPGSVDVLGGQGGGASGRYLQDRRAAKARFRRGPSCRLHEQRL